MDGMRESPAPIRPLSVVSDSAKQPVATVRSGSIRLGDCRRLARCHAQVNNASLIVLSQVLDEFGVPSPPHVYSRCQINGNNILTKFTMKGQR
jgi:hypothetical protein